MVATGFRNISSAQLVIKIKQISILPINNDLTHATYMAPTLSLTFEPYILFFFWFEFVDVIQRKA